jgi:hypothetical protein
MEFQGMAGQKNDDEKMQERPAVETTGRDGIILPPDPVIPRQVASQQRLLPFHRTEKSAARPAECPEKFKTRQTRLPGPGHFRSQPGRSKQQQINLKTNQFFGTTESRKPAFCLYINLFTCWF